jgi:ribonucleoside-diphosphate reductase alpha chain
MSLATLDIGQQIWDMKYRYRSAEQVLDKTVDDTWWRVAKAVAAREEEPEVWAQRFHDLLADYRFLPGGRILANAGTTRSHTTMFNCYVMNRLPDSLDGIFQVVREAALTQKQGGGVGFDFSTIRPKGDHIQGVDSQASGPISFMRVLDATCRTIMSAGQRRGAQMAVLRCDHPDIEEFITAKRQKGELNMFNLSVAVTDAFVAAVKADAEWPLVFSGKTYKTLPARQLWQTIMESTYHHAEPGVLFVDRVNALNNLYYCETIAATNPCGEQPLPPYGACLLGSINLSRFVAKPFERDCEVDFTAIAASTRLAVRFLDNVIDLSNYPLPEQRAEAVAKRRMGIGLTGLADCFAFMRLRYGSPASLSLAEKIMETITLAAYEASSDLGAEKDVFPLFDAEPYLKGAFVQRLPEALREKIRRQGLRNSHLTSIAPTGTISLFASNVSSGLEPIFALYYTRRIRQGDEGDTTDVQVRDYAYDCFVKSHGEPSSPADLPEYFVTADAISPRDHLLIQARLQRHVDSAISKTINIPEDFPFERFQDVYLSAFDEGLKGCTTFRPNANISGILIREEPKAKPATSDTSTAAAVSAPAPCTCASESATPTKTAAPVAKAPAPEASKSDLPSFSDAPPPRPYVLRGTTYKIKTPLASDALYVTINDLEENGRCRPYELFINTKNLQHFSWIVAMTRLISAVFRREPDPSFLVAELKSIYDPSGGYFSGGRYIPSLAADIGRVIEEHLAKLGLVPASALAPPRHDTPEPAPEPAPQVQQSRAHAGICPHCQERALHFSEGCWRCKACDFSKCE